MHVRGWAKRDGENGVNIFLLDFNKMYIKCGNCGEKINKKKKNSNNNSEGIDGARKK